MRFNGKKTNLIQLLHKLQVIESIQVTEEQIYYFGRPFVF